MKRTAGVLILIELVAAAAIRAAGGGVPTPNVVGPVAATGIPGSAAHNYTFFASNHELASHGYLEQEFFYDGTAHAFTTPAAATGAVVPGDHPYKTRLVVRRPADPRRFNGTVLVEWDNVTNNFDAENVCFFAWEHMLSDGYAWVGVSAQNVGITALKKFSSERYGTLDVAHGGAVTGDGLSFDIFSQAGQAIKNPGAVDVLGGLKPRHVFAVGESQSAGRLATYINSIHPLANVYDGFLLLSSNGKIRTDVPVPVWRISTEYDIEAGGANSRQPDIDMIRSWEIAGTSHVDHHMRQSREPLELRDIGTSSEAAMAPGCAVPTVGTRVPVQYVLASAFDLLVRWSEKKGLPPSAPPLSTTSTTVAAADENQTTRGRGGNANRIVMQRDANGLALGGIRLAEVVAPIGLNNGTNTGAGACARWGYYKPFDVATLNKLYPSHAAYVSAVEKATNENLKAGFILKADADRTIQQARDSAIGRFDSLDSQRVRPLADFDRAP